jgi:hypothetical protein
VLLRKVISILDMVHRRSGMSLPFYSTAPAATTPRRVMMMHFVTAAALGPLPTAADCLVDPNQNDIFEVFNERRQTIPRFGSCCMQDVCGLQCPQTVEAPGDGTSFVPCRAVPCCVACRCGLCFLDSLCVFQINSTTYSNSQFPYHLQDMESR